MSNQNAGKSRTLRVPALARVEGEGAMHVTMRDGRTEDVRFEIYEPPRFYEAFLRGRDYREVPDITARICGICPVAYQMSSCYALEKAMGVSQQIAPQIHTLRDLLYCGEWIESHALHVFMLHLPDFLGFESVISMTEAHGPLVKRALAIKKIGNAIVTCVAGRSVHPVGVRVGGFYRAPEREQLRALLPGLRSALDDMVDLTLFLAEKLAYPDLALDYEFVALAPDDEYPMNRGPIVSSKGLRVEQDDFLQVIEERQVAHSTALHSVIKGRGAYLVGPLARINLNAAKLHPRASELLPSVQRAVKASLPWRNGFLSLPARALETVHALALAVDIITDYETPAQSHVSINPRAGIGAHGTEAPRGVCWHQYRTNGDGTIAAARIIPPTSQNQLSIERDLRAYAEQLADVDDEEATLRCEQLIRNYDPCISCSVHFLKLRREWLS